MKTAISSSSSYFNVCLDDGEKADTHKQRVGVGVVTHPSSVKCDTKKYLGCSHYSLISALSKYYTIQGYATVGHDNNVVASQEVAVVVTWTCTVSLFGCWRHSANTTSVHKRCFGHSSSARGLHAATPACFTSGERFPAPRLHKQSRCYAESPSLFSTRKCRFQEENIFYPR